MTFLRCARGVFALGVAGRKEVIPDRETGNFTALSVSLYLGWWVWTAHI